MDVRILPLAFYVFLGICIKSQSLFGQDFYSELALVAAQMTAMIHAAECVQKFSVLRRDAAEGGPPLPVQFLLTLVFGFFHWFKIESSQKMADKRQNKQA